MLVFILFLQISCILSSLITTVQTRDAIKFFIKHRNIKNFTMEILKHVNDTNTSANWVEYKYIFENLGSANDSALREIGRINSSLKIGIFSNQDTFDCASKNRSLRGYSIDLIKTIGDILKIKVDYINIDDSTNLTNLLKTNDIDLVICHVDSSTDFSVVQFTELYPTIKSYYSLIYKPKKLEFTEDIFILTFAGYLWLAFFALLILLAFCLRISTTDYSKIAPQYESWTWVEITLWAIAAACQQGLSHTPSGFASCLIFFLGYLMAYLLYTGFAAAITSILVQYDASINFNFKNLNVDKLQLVSLESSMDDVRHLKDNFVSTKYVPDLYDLFDNLNRNNRLGIAPTILLTQYMAAYFNYDETAEYLLFKRANLRFTRGFVIARNSPWKKLLNEQILALDEAGILQHTLKRNLKSVQIPDVASPYSSAGREHVGSALILFLAGVSASILFLLAEFLLNSHQQSKNHFGGK